MKNIFLTFLFCITINVQAEIYNFARLDNTHGLSNNQVECILKDSRGFVWIGTNFGLNRYDGYRVKVYKSIQNDSTSLINNAISRIQEDVNGNLWIGGTGNYVVYNVHTEKFIRNLTPVLEPLGIHFIPALVEIDAQKNYYFYNSGDGVHKYDVTQHKLFRFKQTVQSNTLSPGNIVGIRVERGFFWVLQQSGFLERFNEKTNTIDFRNDYVTRFSAGSFIQKHLYLDSNGCPWVYPGIGDKGVFYYNMAQSAWVFFGNDKKDFHGSSDKLIASNFVRDIKEDQKHRIWLATDHGGINIYDKSTNEIKVLLNDPMNPNSLSQNSAISLFCDNTGIMWVGTYKNGVSYYHPGMFKFDKSPLFYYHNPDLENKDCNVLHEDRKGNLWIGTNGSGVLKLDKGNETFHLYRNKNDNPSSISSDIIISMLEDKKGTMWFGTFLGGLNQMQGERFVRYFPDVNNPNSLSNKSVYGLVEDHQQNIWIATLGGGLDRLDATRKNFRRHDIGNVPGLLSNVILSLYSKDSTIVYLSTTSGINVLNTVTNTITPLFRDRNQMNKLSDLIIYNTLVDCRNQLWIATDNGINVYNPKTNSISYLKMANGLPTDQVVSLVEDNSGNIWAGTRNGLACIYCKTNPTTHKYEYNVVSFDENDGLLSSILNQNAVFKNKQGKIYIGCTKGYTVFDPQTIHFNKIVPEPRFTEILIANDVLEPGAEHKNRVILDESITHKNRIELNYDDKNFTINFSALSYIHPEKNRYRYKLKGFDEDWLETKNGIGSATYSNLNQGTYQFIVYASNNDNVWSTKPLILEVVILPPFWLTWWAFIIYFLLGMLLLWYIVNFNLRKQKREFENAQRVREAKQLHEMDEMKFRFFTNISHEFRTPLTLIISPVEKLLREAKSDDEKSLLSIIHRNANGLLELVNQLLDFRKLDVQKDTLNLSVGDVVAFIKDICYSFTELANRKAINFSFSTSVSELRMEFDPEKMRKVISNLLSNAFKFTPNNGKIDVTIGLIQQLNDAKQTLKITVADSGIGIPAKDLERVFERFYRVENAENGNQTGTGVGLHIVSEYVKLHNGDIGVESQPGKGSVFTFALPVTQHIHEEIISQNVQEEEIPEELTGEEAVLVEDHRSKLPLMLVVDDNEDFRNFISAMFTDSYRILKAEDGEIALKIILDKMPDLIICDVMMPNMDGFELCRMVKQDIRISHIPIILLTAKAGEENKYKGLEAGAEDYIAKPFNMEMLTLKVSRIIERQKKTRDQFKHKVDITTTDVEITSMDEKFVKKAVALVEENLSSSEFLVEDLCREMGMSRVYFYKKILSLTDKTPSEFIRFIRLKRAADLLEKSQLFVNEVAFQVGFNDPKYFRKYFKDEYGVSPNEYKKKFMD
ncbi:MAG: two-component regulator propeller domain-containing protein [Paludibacter sp.]|nr:two-component regulator propeller domain-containing protein [Paludibacter sp.]